MHSPALDKVYSKTNTDCPITFHEKYIVNELFEVWFRHWYATGHMDKFKKLMPKNNEKYILTEKARMLRALLYSKYDYESLEDGLDEAIERIQNQ